MRFRNLIFSLATAGAMLGQTGEQRLRSPLAGGAISGLQPSGHIDVRVRGADRTLNVEVEDVNLPAGTQLEVLVNGTVVGKITVSGPPARGGELELNTRDGQSAPVVNAGDVVSVRGAATGVLLSGVAQVRRIDTPAAPPAAQPPAAGGVSLPQVDDVNRLRTGLAGGSLGGVVPSGHVDFRQRSDRNETRLSVEVEDVNLPPGTKLNVEVDGKVVGQITVGAGPVRGGELELDSRNGDFIQSLRNGAVVRVLGPAGPILSGAVQTRSFASGASSSPSADDRSGAASGSTASSGGSGSANDSRVQTPLTGGSISGLRPKGVAEVRTRPGDTRFKVEVEDLNVPQGTVLDVVVGGAVVGKITVGPPPMRGGELELSSRDGATVPVIPAGAVVTVRSATLGTLVTGVVQTRSLTAVPPVPTAGTVAGGSCGNPGGSCNGGSSSSSSGGSSSSAGGDDHGGRNGNSGSGNSGSGSGNSGSGSGSSGSGSGSSGSGSGSSGSGSGSSGSGSGNSGSGSGNSGSGSGNSGSGSGNSGSGSGSSGSGSGNSGSGSGSSGSGSGSSGSGSGNSGSGGGR